jgi:hypothetical protein
VYWRGSECVRGVQVPAEQEPSDERAETASAELVIGNAWAAFKRHALPGQIPIKPVYRENSSHLNDKHSAILTR